LSQADLSEANLSGTDLRFINLSEANLTGVELNKAFVEENWFEKLNGWKTIGEREIFDRYKIVKDSAAPPNYQLKLIKD